MDSSINCEHKKIQNDKVAIGNLRALIGDEIYAEALDYTLREAGGTEAQAEQRVIECLRFLYLVSAFPQQLGGLFIPVEQAIDDVWHYLILQTREYRAFCQQKLPGKFYIEHRSMPYGQYVQEPARERQVGEALRWLPLYRTIFGEFDEHSAPYWTMVRFLREQMAMSLSQINVLTGETD